MEAYNCKSAVFYFYILKNIFNWGEMFFFLENTEVAAQWPTNENSTLTGKTDDVIRIISIAFLNSQKANMGKIYSLSEL